MQKLINSELRYRRLFEATQDGVLILDATTGMIEDVNPYLIKMLGYSREEFVEKNSGKLARLKILKPASMLLKNYSGRNLFVMKTCR